MSKRNFLTNLLIIIFLVLSIQTKAYNRIESESYSTMSGIQLENANTTVGYIDAGDWIAYSSVDFSTGPSSVIINTAKSSVGGSIEMRIDGLSGTLIGTFIPTSTNSWTFFQNQTCKIQSVSGIHDLYLVATGVNGVCNIDYFVFSDTKIYEPNWVVSWSDEFNGSALDESVWSKVNDGNPSNGELQFYTPRADNVLISDGTLKLIARKETYTGQGPWMTQPVTREYTSGKIESQGKKTFKYGRIEARMKLPRGKGSWPAFWMLGENLFNTGIGWPRCGEIDIMEHGQDFNNLGAAIHTQAYNHTIGTQKTGTYIIDNYDTDFHVYGTVWSTDKLSFSVDGNTYFSVSKSDIGNSEAQWPFDQPFWLILNHAVGGAWGGTPDVTLFPLTTEIDWVRVYQDVQTDVKSITSTETTISVYPNPTSDYVKVDVNDTSLSSTENNRIILTDITGKVLEKVEVNRLPATINLKAYSRGAYLITLQHENKNLGTSIIIKK